MVVKAFAYFKRLGIISAALLVFAAGINLAVRADSSDQDTPIIAQNETQPAADEKNATATESRETGIKAGEAQESTAAQKRLLKDFKPSEQIEAEQAVDFPYDI
jgi:hypothetical protein